MKRRWDEEDQDKLAEVLSVGLSVFLVLLMVWALWGLM